MILIKTKKITKKLLSAALCLALVMPMLLPTLSIAVANATTFSDLSQNHWAFAEITDLAQRGVINGFPDGTYRPNDAVTREQFARLVVALIEEPTETEEIFDDVPEGRWSNAYVTAAVRRGIIMPETYGVALGANEPITREEAAVWMIRGLGIGVDGTALGFADSGTITYRGEIATAVEIGLITGMPGNLFMPDGLTTRAQAAALVTRMSGILYELTAWDGEEIHHYVYRSDITVINEAPSYSFVEENGIFTITVYNPNDDVRQLGVGDTFVLEPTEQQPGGLAGRVISNTPYGANLVIVASMPEALDEIFYEFEFRSEINLLEYADEIILSNELTDVSGVEIIRNRNSFVSTRLDNVNIAGVILNGEVRLDRPTLQHCISLRSVNFLVVNTTANVDLVASSQMAFERTIPLFTIPIRKVGTGFDVPVALRITADGRFHLELASAAEVGFGIRGSRAFSQVNISYEYDFDWDARVAVYTNIQTRARILWVDIYGVQGNFGRGFQSNQAMQGRCPVSSCLVVGLFHVRRISSLTDWGIFRNTHLLRFDLDLAPRGFDYRYFSIGRWHRFCPHGYQETPTVSLTQPPQQVAQPPSEPNFVDVASPFSFSGQGRDLNASVIPLSYVRVGVSGVSMDSAGMVSFHPRAAIEYRTANPGLRGGYIAYSVHSLGGNFNALSGTIMIRVGAANGTLNFYGDGGLIQSIELSHASANPRFSVNVANVQQLKIEVVNTSRGGGHQVVALVASVY